MNDQDNQHENPQDFQNPPEPPPGFAAYASPVRPPEENENTASTTFTAIAATLLGIFNWIVVPLALVLFLHFFVFKAFHVVGNSMVPTLHESDYLIVSQIERSLSKFQNKAYIPKRGEIIVFRYPKDLSLVFVKRVIALPGERVVIRNGLVKVYNQATPQGFTPDTGYQTSSPHTIGSVDEIVPEGSVFVIGDNRSPDGSFDSRAWGSLPSNYIIGKAVVRLLPLDQVKILSVLQSARL